MDGKTALIFTHNLIRGLSTNIPNSKLTYDLLNAGAEEFVLHTECITDTTDITTVADQASYDLPANYMKLYAKTADPKGGEYWIRYEDGSSVEYTILYRALQKVLYDHNETSVDIPSYFTLHEESSLGTQVSGTTTAAGALSGGQATLTDSAASFTSSIAARDIVHNGSRNANGVVLSVTSDTALVTAVFDYDGNAVPWASGDAYVIQPTMRMQVKLDPPPDTASETVTVPYIAKPNPVYSDYGTWRINDVYHKAFCFYAAWLYLTQYVAQDPQDPATRMQATLSAQYRNEFDRMVHIAKRNIDLSRGKTGYSMKMDPGR